MNLSAADQVKAYAPEWGLVLGSGLGPLVERVAVAGEIAFEGLDDLPPSRVPGHSGRFVWGELAGVRVIVSQGRVHLYEGWSAAQVTAGVRWMAKAGIQHLVLTNAAGTLNRDHMPGTWMMLTDHLNLTGTTPLLGGPHFVDMSEIYSKRLRARFLQAAADTGMPLHTGVYAGLLGPQYETPAEIRMLAAIGADAVGMSTVLEAIQARALGVEVAGFSCLTNWAAGVGTEPLSHAEVIHTGAAAGAAFASVLESALRAD